MKNGIPQLPKMAFLNSKFVLEGDIKTDYFVRSGVRLSLAWLRKCHRTRVLCHDQPIPLGTKMAGTPSVNP